MNEQYRKSFLSRTCYFITLSQLVVPREELQMLIEKIADFGTRVTAHDFITVFFIDTNANYTRIHGLCKGASVFVLSK